MKTKKHILLRIVLVLLGLAMAAFALIPTTIYNVLGMVSHSYYFIGSFPVCCFSLATIFIILYALFYKKKAAKGFLWAFLGTGLAFSLSLSCSYLDVLPRNLLIGLDNAPALEFLFDMILSESLVIAIVLITFMLLTNPNKALKVLGSLASVFFIGVYALLNFVTYVSWVTDTFSYHSSVDVRFIQTSLSYLTPIAHVIFAIAALVMVLTHKDPEEDVEYPVED